MTTRRAAWLVALLALVAAVPAAAAPTPLVELGRHLYGQHCVACHGMNGVRTPRAIGFGRSRTQTEQEAVAPSLVGVGISQRPKSLQTYPAGHSFEDRHVLGAVPASTSDVPPPP